MKRFYVILVLAIAIALALGVGLSNHTGYVLITYPHVLHYESSLWATLVAVFAYVVEGSWPRKLLLALMAVPIAILGNVLRVSSLLWVADRWGVEAGFTYYHDYSGIVFFLFAFACLILFARLLGCREIRSDLL